MTLPQVRPGRFRLIDAVRRLGVTRLARLFVLLLFLGAMIQTVTNLRADLARPTDLSSDTGNYFAAGQRLNDGSPLYRLDSGDRPVAQDNAPLWTVPLLSPPTIAVLWRPLSLAPASFVVQLWWLGGAFATSVTVLWLILRLPAGGLFALLGLIYPLAVVAWSGNVNAYILPALASVWPLSLSPGTRSRILAGVLVGLTGAVKLAPILLSAWFFRRRDRAAVAAVGLTVFSVAGLIAAFAGIQSGVEYLEIARTTTTAGATPWSPTGWLLAVGVSEQAAKLGPFLVGLTALAGSWLLRSRPRASFAALAAGAAFASPVARVETLAMLAVCLVPWTVGLSAAEASPRGSIPALGLSKARLRAVVAASVAVVVGVAGVRAATSPTSDVWLQNDTAHPMIVRFYVNVVPASFGYELPARSGGWAWTGQPGDSDVEVVAYGDGCTVLERTLRVRVTDATVTLTPEGMRLVPGSPGDDRATSAHGGAFLAYTHDCAGA